VANLMLWITAPLFGFLFVAAHPVITLVLGRQWQAAAPVFQILVISALGQLLYESSLWLFISRGESGRLLRLLLFVSPIIVGSFAVGLPFGIKGVALAGSVVLIGIFPWILKYTFRGTSLNLRRLGQAIVCPIALSVAGILTSELALHLIAPARILPQLLVAGFGFATAYLLSALMRPVRDEALSLRELLAELRLTGEPV